MTLKSSRTVIPTVIAMVCVLLLTVLATPALAAGDVDWEAYDSSDNERIVYSYAELPDGRIFISTGYNINSTAVDNQTWIYDPYAKAWDQVADCPNVTESSAAVAMPDGNVYVFGGMNGPLLEHVLVYNVEGDAWGVGPAMAEKRIILEAVALDDHRILLAGGLNGQLFSDITTKCWIYDTITDVFSVAADMPEARFSGSMVIYGDHVYYFGGADATGTGHGEIFGYSIYGDFWYDAGDLPVSLVNTAAVAGSDGTVYLMGGIDFFSWWSSGSNRSYAYNTYSKEVTALPDLQVPVLNAAAFELEGGRIMYMLGNNGSEGNTDVFTLQTWDTHASLSAATVSQGDSVRLHLSITSNFMEMHGMSGVVYLVKDNVTYASYYVESAGESDVSLEMLISESLPAGEYTVIFDSMNIGYGWDQNYPFDPLHLTVLEAPSIAEQMQGLQDQLDALEQQNEDLQDQLNQSHADLADALDALEQQNEDMQDQLSALNGDLDDTRAELADVQDSADGKMDATFGYVILILVLITLVVGVVILVRKK